MIQTQDMAAHLLSVVSGVRGRPFATRKRAAEWEALAKEVVRQMDWARRNCGFEPEDFGHNDISTVLRPLRMAPDGWTTLEPAKTLEELKQWRDRMPEENIL